MEESIGLDLEIRLQGVQSLKDLKGLIKDAKSEALKFGEGTEEFRKFTDIAGRATDKVQDLNKAVASMDPSAKAQAFANLTNTIVGGFSAATGAAALFGIGNEDVNKALLKIQATTLLLQGIQAIADAQKQAGIVKNLVLTNLQQAAESRLIVVRYAAIAAQTILNAVMNANPIFLIVTAIAAAIGAYKLLINIFDDTSEKLQEQNDILNRNIEALKKENTQASSNASLKLKIAEEEKRSLEEIHKLKVRNLEDELQGQENLSHELTFLRFNIEAQIKNETGTKRTELEKQLTDVKNQLEEIRNFTSQYGDKRKLLDLEFNNEKEKRDKEAHDKEVERIKEKNKKIKEETEKHEKELKDFITTQHEQSLNDQKKLDEEAFNAKLKSQKDRSDLLAAKEKEANDKSIDLIKQQKDEFLKAEEEKKNSRLKNVDSLIQSEQMFMGAYSNLMEARLNNELKAAGNNEQKKEEIKRQAFERQKKFEEATAIINGLTALTKIAAEYPKFDFGIATAIGIAAQIASTAAIVAKIRSTQYQGGGGSVSLPSAGAVSAPNIQPKSIQTGADVAGGKDQRIYVLETDITKSQNRVRKIQDRARIG